MTRVYKYPVSPGLFSHLMTDRVDMLTVRVQGQQPQMWALVDTSAAPQNRYFVAVSTGRDIEQRVIGYVGSFEINEGTGDLMFHVFEVHP